MTGSRRLSLAVSEGDGISLVVPVRDAAQASGAEQDGADAILAEGPPQTFREATALPMLCRAAGLSPADAVEVGADGYVLSVAALDDEDRLRALYAEALSVGLEPVLAVADEEELEVALENVDPEIFLLAPHGHDGVEQLESVLDLLPDVPAGKLAIAEVRLPSQDTVIALERAGVDGVIVPAADLPLVRGDEPPEV